MRTTSLPTKGSLLSGLVSTFNKGKDVEYLEAYGQRINAITLDDIQENADKVLKPDAMTWVIVGDLAEIEDKIRELNLGEVTILSEEDIK